jgi:DNA-binding LacI/PurR family transcriptional regulator
MKQQRFMDYVSERLRQARYTAEKAQEAYLQAAGQIAALEELLQRSIDGSIMFPGQEVQQLQKEEET